MEFSIDAVANRLILLLFCLAALVAIGGALFFRSFDAVPFAVGAGIAGVANAIRVLWLKKVIQKSVEMDTSKAAGLIFQVHYFLRIVFTGLVLLVAQILPDNIVNLFAVIIGILTFPVAMRLIQFFIPPDAPMSTEPPTQREAE